METASLNQPKPDSESSRLRAILQTLRFIASLYVFFLSIELMSAAFKLAGRGFAENLLSTTSDPLAGLILGILATSLVQSSSSTTSIVVGLVAAGTLPLRLAIPVIMGANIGTTVTNTIVSMGHVTRRGEFKHAFAASTVHDFFNVLAVLIILPIEIFFHPVEHIAVVLEEAFAGIGGVKFVSPLQQIVKPVAHWIADLLPHTLWLLGVALLGLFGSLSQMVKVMRQAIMTRVESLFNRILFRNDFLSFILGIGLTGMVQSSSVTTSLIVPLVGTGVLTIKQVFPYTLGANIGTTVTAILASFATGSPLAITVALAHLTFNLLGIILLYPVRAVPIWLASKAGELASRSKGNAAMVIILYIALYALPIMYLIFR